jgi:nucleoside-diphosphate-sugar epimerase
MPMLGSHAWELHGVRRPGSTWVPDDESPFTWHEGDLRDPARARALVAEVRPTHILHLAWNAEHGVYWSAPDNRDWAEGTIALARAFAEQGGRRFVGAGTCAEYDWTAPTDPCREGDTPCVPATPYGQAKLAAGAAVIEVLRQHGGSAAWGRLFFLYGPGEDRRRLVPSVVNALRTGQRAQVTAGTQVRDFLHVHDAARAFVALLTAPLEGPVNIGSGAPVSVRTLVETIALCMGRSDAVDFGAIPMPADEPAALVADVTRLLSIGWQPQVSLARGILGAIRD